MAADGVWPDRGENYQTQHVTAAGRSRRISHIHHSHKNGYASSEKLDRQMAQKRGRERESVSRALKKKASTHEVFDPSLGKIKTSLAENLNMSRVMGGL